MIEATAHNDLLKEKEMKTYEEIAAIMNEEIHDRNLKEFLFRMTNIKKSSITGIGILYKMLMLAFFFANAKYKHDLEQKRNVRTSPNAIRAAEAFDYLYNGEDVSLDLVIYLLTEMQLDVACEGESAYYASVFSNHKDATQVPVYRGLIKTWLRSADYVEKNETVLAGLLYGLYRALDVLRNIELRENSSQIVNNQEIITYDFYYIPTKEIISGYGLFKNIEENFYYLESYEVVNNPKGIRLVYSVVDGKMEHIDVIEMSDFYQKMKQKLFVSPKSIFAKSLYSLDFKYIKNLALAVSDVITLEMKKKINAHFSLRYSDVFELGYKGFKDINWDNVLTILMFEEGPSNILEFVLDSDGFCFDKVLKNLEIRYNDRGFSARAKRFYDEEQRKEMEVLKNHTEINASFVKNMIEINKILMAKAIVNELAILENNKKSSNACFVESLPMRIKNLNDVMNSQDSISAKVLEANRALEKTFRYIIPFYYGIIEYNKIKDQLETELDCKDEERFSEDLEKKHIYEKGEKAFKKKALEIAKDLARKPLGELVRSFRELIDSLTDKKGHIVTITENGKNLKGAIGRSSLCAKEVFENILKIDTEGMLAEYIPKQCDIVGYINNVKHSKKGGTTANIVLFNKFWLAIKEIFYFFIYNEDYRREMLLGQQISYDPIYPYVVQYEEKSERRDCCNISSFSVYLTEDNGKKEIKILSEQEYTINEKYYCIPNAATSNSRWWIEPFMINCREYDQLIADAMDEKKLKERQMEDED